MEAIIAEVEYIPVPIRRITVDTSPDFDLYIETGGRHVLYRKANLAFSRDNLENLAENNISSLFIHRADLKRYTAYRLKVRHEQEKSGKFQGYSGIFTDPAEVEHYHRIREEYFLIDSRLFDCSLPDDIPVFYRMNNEVFPCGENGSARDNLELLIRMEDLPALELHLESLERKADAGQRALLLKEQTKLLINDFFHEPKSGDALRRIETAARDLVEITFSSRESVDDLVRLKSHDFLTYEHSVNVGVICASLGSALGMFSGEIAELVLGGFLHDIGKLAIGQRMLNKPGHLTIEESRIMQKHVAEGVSILSQHKVVPPVVLEMASQHHEKISGGGYPNGLSGDEIGFAGRLSAVADVFDAMTTERPYKKASPAGKAAKFLAGHGEEYDRQIAQKLFETVMSKPGG